MKEAFLRRGRGFSVGR